MNKKIIGWIFMAAVSMSSFSVLAQSKMVRITSGSFEIGSPASERQELRPSSTLATGTIRKTKIMKAAIRI